MKWNEDYENVANATRWAVATKKIAKKFARPKVARGKRRANGNRTKTSPPRLARQWGIDVNKVLNWIRAGELRAIDASTRVGGRPRYLIDVADIAAFERRRTVIQPPVPHHQRRSSQTAVIEWF